MTRAVPRRRPRATGADGRKPAPGRHYLVVSRAKVGGVGTGDFGSFVLTLDEVR
jgi:hypothetical protein